MSFNLCLLHLVSGLILFVTTQLEICFTQSTNHITLNYTVYPSNFTNKYWIPPIVYKIGNNNNNNIDIRELTQIDTKSIIIWSNESSTFSFTLQSGNSNENNDKLSSILSNSSLLVSLDSVSTYLMSSIDINNYDISLNYTGTGNGNISNTGVYAFSTFSGGEDKHEELEFTSSTFVRVAGDLQFETINGSNMCYIDFEHKLNKKPSISAEQEGSPGQVALMPVKYIDNNKVRVYFGGTTSGKIFAN